ncbi:hypothetical protein SAMN05421540_102181 [Psychroflexus halocasei]|uniref:Uncharacterized protein n=1 Tax=Psychroflexus halocasei TaxID=908615 RepID=A0A1H3WXW2_9FLAO|nr:hypothetical protein SAMN05421540_102181 [Psychroflexus halocasei]
MKLSKTTILYALAAIVTIYGLVTGRFLFIFLAFPLGLFSFMNKNDKNN